MDEQLTELSSTAARLATAAEGLREILTRLDAQQETLTAKVDRIVAAIDEHTSAPSADVAALRERVTQLERENADLKAQATAPGPLLSSTAGANSPNPPRKTLPALVSTLLSKGCGVNDAEAQALDSAALDKALASLSLEQRIAVKAEMARAGLIE